MDKTLLNIPLVMDGLDLLDFTLDGSVSCCIFDPQYRQILDKLKFGNEGERQKKRALLKQMDVSVIQNFIHGIHKVLIPSSYLFLWCDKFIVAEGLHKQFFETVNSNEFTNMSLVDMIVWDKQSFGMGKRSRRTNEYLLVYQKIPKTTLNWTDKGIRDTWSEKIIKPRDGHPHRKPMGLTKRLIECVTKEGDIVIDPCAGSFSTLKVCKKINRNFIGCDLTGEYIDEDLR